MCSPSCLRFGRTHLTADDVAGKSVLEVGALDVNGSLREHVKSLHPAAYLGVDIERGPGVDEICDAGDLVTRFGPEAFDLVLATELLEHVREWQRAIRNLEQVLRPGGVLLITTRSRGFPYHAYPGDYWRYELEDMREIFSDLTIEVLESDPLSPGVFVRCRRPENLRERDLSEHALYSIALGRRVPAVTTRELRRSWRYRRIQAVNVLRPVARKLFSPGFRRRVNEWLSR